MARGLAERAVELVLENARDEVARVRDVRGNVILRARIEVLLACAARGGATPWYFARSSHHAALYFAGVRLAA